METHSTISDWVKDLDMADGLKQLLIDAGFTIESVIRLGYQDLVGNVTYRSICE
jgi:hypothetical protein